MKHKLWNVSNFDIKYIKVTFYDCFGDWYAL